MKDLLPVFFYDLSTLKMNIDSIEERLRLSPEGSLKVHHIRGGAQFYNRRMTPGTELASISDAAPTSAGYSVQGKSFDYYIKKEQMDLVKKLAQKDYDRKLLKELKTRYNALLRTYKVYAETNPYIIFEKSCAERQKLIVSEYLPDKNYAEMWQGLPYKKKGFVEGEREIYTIKEERVRSKSEKIIADTFERKGIPYRYEALLVFQEGIQLYPDFTVLNKRTREVFYLEHFGMMDDPEYAERAVRRIEEYEQHGILPGKQLLITFETKRRPLNMKTVDIIIQEYFL